MFYGFLSGMLWGGNSILLGIVLSMTPFISTKEAIFLAPFVCAFLNDSLSSILVGIYMMFKRQLINSFKAFDTKSGRCISVAAIFAGPVGMTANLVSMQYIGPAYTALITAMYPAVGAVFSNIFLKEKIKLSTIVGLIISILGVVVLGYSPNGKVTNFTVGFIWAIIAVLAWACEAVICAYGMSKNEITAEQSMQIRQVTSALIYGCLIIPLVGGIKFTIGILSTPIVLVLILVALSSSIAYGCYYKGIKQIGATRSMALSNTCSAWALFFGVILLGNSVDIRSIICCILIISGSFMAGKY